MSIPWCTRPQRQPNGLVIGPWSGQTRPAADGVRVVRLAGGPGGGGGAGTAAGGGGAARPKVAARGWVRPRQRRVVWPLERGRAPGLEGEGRVQLVEPLPSQRQVLLEGLEL